MSEKGVIRSAGWPGAEGEAVISSSVQNSLMRATGVKRLLISCRVIVFE